MQYRFNGKAFGEDFNKFLKEIECNQKTAALVTGLGLQSIRRIMAGKGCYSEALAIICYWANLDIRHYVIDEPGQSKPHQRSLRFGLVTLAGRGVPDHKK